VGEEFKEEFEEAGGERWDLVESLNDNKDWVQTLKSLILKKSSSDILIPNLSAASAA
jgi:ferrochelatase